MALSDSSSKAWAKLIENRCAESLVFVMVEPKETGLSKIHAAMKKIKILSLQKIANRKGQKSYCTGFVIEQTQNDIKLLTSAHCIEHVFSAKHKISLHDVREMFKFSIICDHHEKAFRASSIEGKERRYSEAKVAAIDCTKDLLLLVIGRGDLLGFGGKACQEPHPPLLPSKQDLGPLDSTAMISWPSCRPRTSAAGEISHCSRDYTDVSDTNKVGYDMRLVEVNIPGQDGSSGAPLLDDNGGYLGMLHAGGKDCFSCFTSLQDILHCLSKWGIQFPSTSTEAGEARK